MKIEFTILIWRKKCSISWKVIWKPIVHWDTAWFFPVATLAPAIFSCSVYLKYLCSAHEGHIEMRAHRVREIMKSAGEGGGRPNDRWRNKNTHFVSHTRASNIPRTNISYRTHVLYHTRISMLALTIPYHFIRQAFGVPKGRLVIIFREIASEEPGTALIREGMTWVGGRGGQLLCFLSDLQTMTSFTDKFEGMLMLVPMPKHELTIHVLHVIHIWSGFWSPKFLSPCWYIFGLAIACPCCLPRLAKPG